MLDPGTTSGFISRLRFPQLLFITGALFVVDLFLPDPIPFVDEILLALVTAILATLRRPKPEPADPGPSGRRPEKDVTPRR